MSMGELGNNVVKAVDDVVKNMEIPNKNPSESATGKGDLGSWRDVRDKIDDFQKTSPFEGTLLSENRIPISKGEWEGGAGDSTWRPARDHHPQVFNPEGKTWGEILDGHGKDGIPFKDGDPDFSDIAEDQVEIDDFTDNRADNFAQADEKLAQERGCTVEEIREWRKENGYTWHECKDQKTMQLVPSEIHNNIPHSGGISEAKKAKTEMESQ